MSAEHAFALEAWELHASNYERMTSKHILEDAKIGIASGKIGDLDLRRF